jgi:colicin import membrane protein
MDRLSKKCVITSAIVHGTLVLVLIVGPAFLGSDESQFDPKEIIDFIPAITIDKSMSGGGNPNVAQVVPVLPPPTPKPVQAQPPQPKPEPRRPDPEPEKAKPEPAPKQVERNTPKPDPESLEPVSKPSKPKINLALTTRPPSKPTSTDTSAAERRQREKADRERAERIVSSALTSIRSGASGSVKIDELRGPGGGGLPYAGFNQALISAYMRAWLIPSDAAEEDGKVVATITLSRDGSVISARISKSSGNSKLDQSVQRALDKVSFVAPFPESTKDAQKTFGLEFDPKAKRMAG